MAVRPEEFQIKRAERKQARLRFAVCAASNGGKTWSSLEVAFGIVEEMISRGILSGTLDHKVGLIDSERKSAQLYSHLGPFDTIELEPPYSVERYMGAITAFERAGVAVIIIDQISHAWSGEGGVLSILNRFNAGERFSAFGTDVNPEQDKFVDAMLKSPAHIIATMRSKTAWVMQEKQGRNGQMTHSPKRVGMAPIQRPGIEFEFTTMVNLETDTHVATVIKNRCPLFTTWQPKVLTREHGRALAAWLLEGAPGEEPVVTGTPKERADATADLGIQTCQRAANLPDLQRGFQSTVDSLRAFSGVVDEPYLVGLTKKVVAAKDLRKQALGAGERATGPVITPEDADDLEAMCTTGAVSRDAILTTLKVARFAMLLPDRLREASDAIQDEVIAEHGEPVTVPPRLAEKLKPKAPPAHAGRKDPFEGFADDLPWQP